jgi:hypothetical protein
VEGDGTRRETQISRIKRISVKRRGVARPQMNGSVADGGFGRSEETKSFFGHPGFPGDTVLFPGVMAARKAGMDCESKGFNKS